MRPQHADPGAYRGTRRRMPAPGRGRPLGPEDDDERGRGEGPIKSNPCTGRRPRRDDGSRTQSTEGTSCDLLSVQMDI